MAGPHVLATSYGYNAKWGYYCGGGPVGSTDPSGLSPIMPVFLAAGNLILQAMDIVDVIRDPGDPLIWIGLADPTPIANVIKYLNRIRKAAAAAEAAADAAKVAADASKAIAKTCEPIKEGVYRKS